MSYRTICADELGKLAQIRNVDLIDVRTPNEFQEVHAAPARNIPLDQLDPKQLVSQIKGGATEYIYFICKSGMRAKKACDLFESEGFSNAVLVEDGIPAWEHAGLPVIKGRKAVSLERQVRIAAGTLVLLGTILAQFVHPYFIALSGFVGAGLIFAGITDTCGMAFLLARMPWNKGKTKTCPN